MDHLGQRLNSGAAGAAVIPIAGILGGLIFGVAWAALRGGVDFDALWIVAKSALVGSFLGMGTAIVVATGGSSYLTTIRGLACLIGITALLLVFWVAIP